MERFLALANSSLILCVAGLCATILIAYPLAEAFSMAVQILAHIGTLLFAVGVKVSYVARLAFLSRLGRPLH
ncbi:hypothetical protein MSNKSG1_10883 [Marinobacter santoriniensis NKSG1]|jgi:uncharacterized protein YjeT (DUF2065 family)|uniref:Uncharacterized protein n=1 Tax=Marinobacter santoriniensis NKSG1 TaxID=1288826 RepID=M7CTC0_9GAMM|nr:hypothetical protein [Marinobacter santoriniensis]EMP56374.1 hypothetical protein MSNKSG1_10883 [Marinobacter santoriniensis NKSG1]